MEVWRTPDIDTRWTVSHRYSDFAQLQSTLKVGSMVLPQLPPKKVFGNTDRDFINERKVALQVTSWWNYDEFFFCYFLFSSFDFMVTVSKYGKYMTHLMMYSYTQLLYMNFMIM